MVIIGNSGLNYTNVEVPLATGIDSKTDPSLVEGKLLELINAETKNGIIVKSTGYDSILNNVAPQSATNPSPKMLSISYTGSLRVFDNDSTYQYSNQTNNMTEDGKYYLVDRDESVIASEYNHDLYSKTRGYGLADTMPSRTLDSPGNPFNPANPVCASSVDRLHNALLIGEYGDYIVNGYVSLGSTDVNTRATDVDGVINSIVIRTRIAGSTGFSDQDFSVNKFSLKTPTTSAVMGAKRMESITCMPNCFMVTSYSYCTDDNVNLPSIIYYEFFRYNTSDGVPFYTRTYNMPPGRASWKPNVNFTSTPLCARKHAEDDWLPLSYFPFTRAVYTNGLLFIATLKRNTSWVDPDISGSNSALHDYDIELTCYEGENFATPTKTINNTYKYIGSDVRDVNIASQRIKSVAYAYFGLSDVKINGVMYVCLFYGKLGFALYQADRDMTNPNINSYFDSANIDSTNIYGVDNLYGTAVYDCVYNESDNTLLFLGHTYLETPESSTLGSLYCPVTIVYSLAKRKYIPNQLQVSAVTNPLYSVYCSLDTNFSYGRIGISDVNQEEIRNYGITHICSGWFYIHGKPCFVLSYTPYLTNKTDIGSNATNMTTTPHTNRNSTLYVLDYKMNIVDKIIDNNAAIDTTFIRRSRQTDVVPDTNIYDKALESYPLSFHYSTASKYLDRRTIPYVESTQRTRIVTYPPQGFEVYNMYKDIYNLRCVTYLQTKSSPSTVSTFGKSNYIASPLLCSIMNFGGLRLHGFTNAPVLRVTPAPVTASGADKQYPSFNGTYLFSAVYTWTNEFGEMVRSAPATYVPVTGTSGYGFFNVFVSEPPYFIKNMRNVTIEIYRSRLNSSVLFMCGQIKQEDFGVERINRLNYRYNAFQDLAPFSSIWFQTKFVDISKDNALGAILYTSGGVLPDAAFPSLYRSAIVGDRFMGVPNINRGTVLYSKPKNTGYALSTAIGLEMANINSTDGDITAIADLDGKAIIFKKNSIYSFLGELADNTGLGMSNITPSKLPTTVGCTEPASVITISEGVLFKSSKGIYLLGRNLTTEYIGAPVEKYNTLTIVSATKLEHDNKVKFATKEGIVIVYDYFYNTWGIEDNLLFTSTVMFEGRYTGITSEGLVLQSNPNSFKRNGQHYSMKVKTAWLRATGLVQGYQRVRNMKVLGDFKSSHQLKCTVAYDLDDTTANTSILNFSDPASTSAPYQRQVNFSRQKCQDIQITLEDIPTGSGESCTLKTLNFEVGTLGGSNRISGGKRTGV
jgi:hypothetical protein